MPCICLVECQLLPYNCTAQNRSWWAPRWRKVRGMPSQLVLLARKHRVDSGFEGKELSLFEIRLSQYLGSRRIEVQPLWMTRLDRRVDSSLCKWDAQYPDFACKTTKPSNINSSRWKQKQSTWHRENVIETCKYRNKPRYREGSSSRNARWSCVCSLRHCMAPPPPYLSKKYRLKKWSTMAELGRVSDKDQKAPAASRAVRLLFTCGAGYIQNSIFDFFP